MSNQASNDYYAQPQSCAIRSSSGSDTKGFLCNCSLRVLAFFAVMLAATLGLIFGILFALALVAAVPSLIILAVILFVGIVGLVIFRLCMCCYRKRCG
ncbi:MAG TPA: hypothetical protein PK438_05115 [Clostridia bacterium]|jgi:hypothetical protein|nr:MAG: hypothetical protein BWY35_01129 [Firmicutes bacterium ADurb.Bin248]HOG00051.1 hypothetical protein [Clostridia bacterium]HOS18648.1 hypothetical protein [Clostridia bacterium]HPK16020.1 hypothetical protein [Clostridia bacterium]